MTAKIQVTIAEADADAERLDELASALREELLRLDVDDVTRAHEGHPPAGARGIDLAVVGVLMVLLQQSVEVVGQVVDVALAWAGRGTASRAVTLTLGDRSIHLTDVSQHQQDRLINEFLQATDER